MTLFWIYVIIGACLVARHGERIAKEVPNPESLSSAVETGLKWIFTWPWWVFRK